MGFEDLAGYWQIRGIDRVSHRSLHARLAVRAGRVLQAPGRPANVTPLTLHNVTPLSTQRLKTATLNLRISPELKALADKAAAEDQRSLTSLVEKLLTDFLKAKGYLKK
ncbi:MAG: hypothetical protein NTAFB05_13590 [Nitrobacter sp.]